jgi:hypothetical protein
MVIKDISFSLLEIISQILIVEFNERLISNYTMK